MVLSNRHIYGLRIVLNYLFQVAGGIQEAVGVGRDGRLADFHKVIVIEQTDSGITAIEITEYGFQKKTDAINLKQGMLEIK